MSITDAGGADHAHSSETWGRPWTHFDVTRPSPGHCRVTLDHPPINTVTATTVAELAALAQLIELDPDLNVVVFDSANPTVRTSFARWTSGSSRVGRDDDAPPQAGTAVYVRGDNGRLASTRIYDDSDPSR